MSTNNFKTTDVPTLCVLHPAALLPNRGGDRMIVPTYRDWTRVREFLDGEWPEPWPDYALATDNSVLMDACMGSYAVIDTEYEPATKRVYQIGFYAPGLSAYIWDENEPSCVSRDAIMDVVRIIFETQHVVLQNAPADLTALNVDYDACHQIDDCLLAHSALWSEWRHNLDFMTSLYGRHKRVKHLGPGSHEYLRGDVVETSNVWKSIDKELNRDKTARHVYETYLRPLIPIMVDVGKRGLRVNTEVVEAKHVEYTAKIRAASQLAEAFIGYPINLDSSPQLGTALSMTGGLGPKPKRTKTGRVSIAKDEIAKLRDKFLPRAEDEELTVDNALDRIERGGHPLLEARAFFIEARQRHSAYIAPLLGRERTYPEFLPFAQATGRWSIIKPPLAQLPHDLRNIVRPDEGEAWIQHDWDGIEARIMAYEANDNVLIEALENGYDLHTINVCDLFSYPLPSDLVDPHQSTRDEAWRRELSWDGKDDVRRVFAKRFLYRLFYGGKPEHAASIPGSDLLVRYGLNKARLVEASKAWLRKHPAITEFWRGVEYDATRKGIVRTFLGRRRVFFERNHAKRIREAYDQPMQGGVADIMNGTVIELWRASKHIGGHLAYTMHDSVKWALPVEHVEAFMPTYKSIVEREFEIKGRRVTFPATYEVRYE